MWQFIRGWALSFRWQWAAGGVGFAALLAWLFIDGFSTHSRAGAINDGLRAGKIGGSLDDRQAADLLETLRWLAAAAGVQGPVRLNQPYSEEVRRQGDIHVYLTSPAAQNVTYCGLKNAVYDAELDAVFIRPSSR